MNQEKAAEEGGEDRDGQDSNQGVWRSVKPQPVAPVPQPGRHLTLLTWPVLIKSHEAFELQLCVLRQGLGVWDHIEGERADE